MLAEKQATSHSQKCELKMRSRTIDYKMNGGLSIKLGHTAVGWLLLVRHFLKCNNSHRVVSGAKITNISVGFLKVILILFHQPLYQWWSIFFPTLVQGEITRRVVNELFIKTYCNAHSSASGERFWPSAKPWGIRGENGFLFNFVLRLLIYSIWPNAVPRSEPQRHLCGRDFPWLLSPDRWGQMNGWRGPARHIK